MTDEIKYKKFYRKQDKILNGTVEAKHGKQVNQKIKPYVVLQYLLKESDENMEGNMDSSSLKIHVMHCTHQ